MPALLSGATLQATEQSNKITAPYMASVVQLTVTMGDGSRRDGFGFVVGASKGFLYAVTANHVVRGADSPDVYTEKVEVGFFHDQGGSLAEADLLDNCHVRLDIALLRIPRPADYPGNPKNYCEQYQRGDRAWFIGRQKKWFIPTDAEAGVIRADGADLDGSILLGINTVRPGTSGAPLLTSKGIVGMIVRDEVDQATAVDIGYIRKFVLAANYPWQLAPCSKENTQKRQKQKEPGLRLRSRPQLFDDEAVKTIVNNRVFFEAMINPQGGFSNDFVDRGETILDRTTGLVWEKQGSEKGMVFAQAASHVKTLNTTALSGYKNWRLPTMEELASLLQLDKNRSNLHVNSLFGNAQHWCWSADKQENNSVWSVNFARGTVNAYPPSLYGWVRGVRSAQE